MALIYQSLLAIVELTIYTVKLSIKVNKLLFLLITSSTRIKIKNKYKIRDKNDL